MYSANFNTIVFGANSSYLNGGRQIRNPNSPDYTYDENDNLFACYIHDKLSFFDSDFILTLDGRADKWKSMDAVFSPKAGVNILLYRNSFDETVQIIEELAQLAQKDKELLDNIESSYKKIIELKKLNFVNKKK